MSDINFEDNEEEKKFYDFISFFQDDTEEESSDLFSSDFDSSFIETVSEDVSTDVVMDLKKGIYNLFVNLINNQIIHLGPEGAVKSSVDYLEEIIYNFKQAINTDQEK